MPHVIYSAKQITMQQYTWNTARIINETADAVTVVFDTKGERFSYKAGQFINLSLEINGEILVRSYSLSSSPGLDKEPAITLKRVPGGLVSTHVTSQTSSIRQWHVEGPFGLFGLPPNLPHNQPLVFIAGGSGITPVYAMIKEALIQTTSPIRLIYSNKTPKDTIFYEALRKLEADFPERLHIQHVFTGEIKDEIEQPKHLKGRLNRLVLKKLLGLSKSAEALSSLYFLCGPEGLIKTGNEALLSFGVPPENIRLEYFSQPAAEGNALLPDRTVEVQLHFYEQTNLLDVAPGRTILEAALSDRVPVPYSCKAGTCGVCTAKITAGRVHMRNNFALDENKVKEGYILLCQSHPLDDEVTVEVGGE